MPYILPEKRNTIAKQRPQDPGELAFAIAVLLDNYVIDMDEGDTSPGVGYAQLALVDGVLGTSQHEFRRRHMDDYEDRKRWENGEVYLNRIAQGGRR